MCVPVAARSDEREKREGAGTGRGETARHECEREDIERLSEGVSGRVIDELIAGEAALVIEHEEHGGNETDCRAAEKHEPRAVERDDEEDRSDEGNQGPDRRDVRRAGERIDRAPQCVDHALSDVSRETAALRVVEALGEDLVRGRYRSYVGDVVGRIGGIREGIPGFEDQRADDHDERGEKDRRGQSPARSPRRRPGFSRFARRELPKREDADDRGDDDSHEPDIAVRESDEEEYDEGQRRPEYECGGRAKDAPGPWHDPPGEQPAGNHDEIQEEEDEEKTMERHERREKAQDDEQGRRDQDRGTLDIHVATSFPIRIDRSRAHCAIFRLDASSIITARRNVRLRERKWIDTLLQPRVHLSP